MFAALNGNTEAVQLWIDAEVNLNTKNKAAANNGHMEVVQMLIKVKADYQSLLPLINGWTGYYGGALKLPNREMYDLLTKLLIKPTIVQAVLQGKTRWMKNMIESGWNVNRKDKDGHTPLMWASAIGNTEIIQILVKANANVNEKNKNGGTSLMNAAYHGHTEIVEILIKADADINAKTKNGATAFMRARHNNHTEIVQLLRKANTDINVKTETVRAAGKSHMEIVKLLENVVKKGNVAGVKLWLDTYGDINVKKDVHERGMSALVYAAAKNHTEFVQLLIKAKVDLNAKKKNGWTALDWAARHGNSKIVKLLIKAKADYQSLLPLVDGWTGVYGGEILLKNRAMYHLLTKLQLKAKNPGWGWGSILCCSLASVLLAGCLFGPQSLQEVINKY